MALTRNSCRHLLHLPDCAGLRENGSCRWLSVGPCVGEGCAYYRKKSGEEGARRRLSSLGLETQEHIAQKYYSGARPWADAGGKREETSPCIKKTT